jgi:hypothetical protein
MEVHSDLLSISPARAGLSILNRLLKNARLPRSPDPSSLRRTFKYASLLRISGALHLGIFEQPEEKEILNRLLMVDSVLLCLV